MHNVILRDDDTNALTPVECLDRLYSPFLEKGLPVNLAVIPDVRTDARTPEGRLEGFLPGTPGSSRSTMAIGRNRELVDYLTARSGYHIVQHGCHHDCFEFDDKDPSAIRKKLERGTQLLADAGFSSPRTFVAPHDKFSRAGLKETARRFEVISTGWFELGRLPVLWWPAYFAKRLRRQEHWRIGRTRLLTHPGCLLSCHRHYGSMLERVQRCVESRSLTVLVTHWWEYFRNGKPDEEFISILHGVADYLAANSNIRVISFDDLVATGPSRGDTRRESASVLGAPKNPSTFSKSVL